MTQPATAPGGPPNKADADAEGEQAPFLDEVTEVVRHFGITEKHHRLYPIHGKVVQASLGIFCETVATYLKTAEQPLHFHITRETLVYHDVEVYREETLANSISGRLHKDGVRAVVFLEDTSADELASFVSCFKETADAEEDEDDFGTVFWEKDCTNIQLILVDDVEEADDEHHVDVPTSHLFALGFDPGRLDVSKEEEQRLKSELAEHRKRDESGDDAFELKEDELGSIRDLAASEETYFAVFDFVDILLEHVARNDEIEALEEAARLIREIISALVDGLDFEHAHQVLNKVTREPHPALSENQRRAVRDAVGEFSDARTLETIDGFLKDARRLSVKHAVFNFMRLLGPDALPQLCSMMEYNQHIPALSAVLVDVGKKNSELFANQMMNPDADIAQAMIHVILNTEEGSRALRRIASALKHQNVNVRKHAAKTILERGDEDVGEFFLPLLEDPPLFPIALQFYAKVSYPPAYDLLAKIVSGKEFHTMEQMKQTACCKALFISDPDRALTLAQSILRWPFCWTKKMLQRRAAAIRGLVYHPSEESRDLILKFSDLKKSPLSVVASQCLRLRDEFEKEQKKGRRPAAPVRKSKTRQKEVQNV